MTKEKLAELLVSNKNLSRYNTKKLARKFNLTEKEIFEARLLAKASKGVSPKSGFKKEIFKKLSEDGFITKGLNDGKQMPKVLLIDTETAPLEAYVWRLWKQTIGWNQVSSQWYMLCWSAKWLYSDDVITEVLTPEEAVREDDSRIMTDLWKLIDECDVLVAHNAKGADIPWTNTRFILNGMTPPTPYHVVDTLEIARKNFAFSSNKLDALAEYFGIEHKIKVDFDLWRECRHGNPKALEEMAFYNKKDVDILEQVFLKLRPWMKGQLNLNNYLDSKVTICATCGSENLEDTGNFYYTSTGKYTLFRCKDCGAITRSRYNLRIPKEIRATSTGR